MGLGKTHEDGILYVAPGTSPLGNWMLSFSTRNSRKNMGKTGTQLKGARDQLKGCQRSSLKNHPHQVQDPPWIL